LVELGADVNVKNKYGDTALIATIDRTSIDKDIVKLLIDNGANVNDTDRDGFTALMHAAKKGDKDIVQLLLENGADTNIESNNGKTALSLALHNKHEDMVEFILQNT
jgi:ankyrin repeat protein